MCNFFKKLNLLLTTKDFLCHKASSLVCIDLYRNFLNWRFYCEIHLAK